MFEMIHEAEALPLRQDTVTPLTHVRVNKFGAAKRAYREEPLGKGTTVPLIPPGRDQALRWHKQPELNILVRNSSLPSRASLLLLPFLSLRGKQSFLDLGTGDGDGGMALAKENPTCCVIGLEFAIWRSGF
jgi:hypothetical protein